MGIDKHWAEMHQSTKCDVPGCDNFDLEILPDGTGVCEEHLYYFDPPNEELSNDEDDR